MTVIYVREEPVVELVDDIPVLNRIKVRCILRLKSSEVNLEVVGHSVVVVVNCLLFLDINNGRCCCSALEIRVCSLIKL